MSATLIFFYFDLHFYFILFFSISVSIPTPICRELFFEFFLILLFSSIPFMVRNDERCREKWVNSLDPSLVFGPFSQREYDVLRKLVELYGVGNWAEKSLWFPGRTDANIMARWKTQCMSGMIFAGSQV